ncbi:T9SS type A sorting domain-containing protein [Chryseobacterium sp. Leaf394]|uniref:T9SS type A sorting domain-containing protein n=1 Tax=Chryseobacterium sp. Leaf394 TaxID=1736361 RepID=UPI00070204FA|nr:T9SS type A sorting domain-containing protein [Chryseobacterium sp. Leaf394]KQS92950.1 hypothetical protein ASG21_11085 [Chryseobacterium sp. Leaf394]
MIKKLLLFVFTLLQVAIFQSKTAGDFKSVFFCDTLAPVNVQITNITQTSVSISWTLDPNTSDYILRIRPVGSAAWLASPIQSGSSGSYTFSVLLPCTLYEVQVAKVCLSIGTWTAPLSFTTLSNGSCSLSLNEVQKNQSFVIYPNPATENIFVRGISVEENYIIYSNSGQIIKSGKTTQSFINIKDLEKGIYFIKINNVKAKFIKK